MRERRDRPLLVPDAFLKPTRFVVKTDWFSKPEFFFMWNACVLLSLSVRNFVLNKTN